MIEGWDTVFSARCGQSLKDDESDIWLLEMRKEVAGWKHDPVLDGRDPLKGDKVKAINVEICSAIRWAMSQSNIPRADGGRSNARYTVSDLILWVILWKKNAQAMDEHPNMDRSDQLVTRAMKGVIVSWAQQKRWDDIAFSIPMPHNYPEMIHAIRRSIGLTEDGQKQLETWVLTEYGMDCRDRRIQWAKENYERVMGLESSIGAIIP